MLIWKRNTESYSNSWDAYLGKWKVGSVFWNALTRGDPKVWAVGCTLPGIKDRLGHYEHEDEGKQRLERAVAYWIDKGGIEEREKRGEE